MTETMEARTTAHAEEHAQTLIGGEFAKGHDPVAIRDPYRGETVGFAPRGSADEVAAAVSAARSAASEAARVPAFRRAAWLHRAAELLEERAPSIAELMARETGKALKDALGEVRRSKDTLTLSAEESIRIEGEHVPLDGSEMGAGRIAMMLRHPVGVVGAITPFNAPVNLAAHKLAPAIAAGNTIVLKAPPQSPLVVHRLVRIFHDAGVPAGFINLVYGGAAEGEALVRDPRVDFITFTGSSRVGEAITRLAGLRRVALELGGNGPTIVHEDADVAVAAPMCARNAVRLAGQSCISVQNVYVHRSLVDAMAKGMVAAMQSLVVGDPLDPRTDVGTLIDEPAAERVENWVREAQAGGARLLVGGERRGAQVMPTLLSDVQPSMKVVCNEVFGPVANLIAYDRIEEAIEAVNASPYGLQCGLFTRSNEITFRAIREIRAGGLIVNGSSTWRTDQLAYGGVKASGIGREGPRYAIRDMTEQRVVVFNL